jgi:nucleotide-binding universal stress UspA family protein
MEGEIYMGTIKNILVDVPHLDSTPTCIELVKQLALNEAAQLTLMTTLPLFADLFAYFDTDDIGEELQDDLEKQASSVLKTLAANIENAGPSCSTVIAKSSRRARKLIARVIKQGHDLLVKDASLEEQGERLVYGNIDQRLVRHCPCPVWLIRTSDDEVADGQVVVAVDAILDDPIHLELNKRLLRYGKMVAELYNVKLQILHIWDFDGTGIIRGSVDEVKFVELHKAAKQAASERIAKFLSKMSIRSQDATMHLLEGSPGRVISSYCQKNPMNSLVIGSVGRSGLSGYLIGNTAERIMNNIECSVLVVNPKQIQSPVELKLREEQGELHS